MKPFDREQLRYVQRLEAERNKLAEWFAIKHRHTELVERQLDRLITELGRSRPAIDVGHPIGPVAGGVNLATDDDQSPPYRRVLAVSQDNVQVDDHWWPRRDDDKPPLFPNAGHAVYPLYHRTRKVLGIAVLGLARSDLEHVLELIARQQERSEDFVPLFLYDGPDFELFRRYGYVFEWIPPIEDRIRFDGRQPWADYLAARRALIERKWGLAYVVSFGTGSLEEVVGPLDDWSGAPAALESAA